MDREQLIVRQAVLKAAAAAISAGTVGIPADEVATRTTEMADYFLEWVYQPSAAQAVSNVVQAFPPQQTPQTAPQPPQNVSEAIPTVCPGCGAKVTDNRLANLERAKEGKPNLPEFKCKGKWKRETNGTFTQIQPDCGWIQWPAQTNA